MEERICSRCGKVFYTPTPEWGYKRGKLLFCGDPCYNADFKEVEAKGKKLPVHKSTKLSEEKLKQLETARKSARKSRYVTVLQYTLDGELVARYGSLKEAARAVGKGESTISLCLSGKGKTAGGFVWKRGDDK